MMNPCEKVLQYHTLWNMILFEADSRQDISYSDISTVKLESANLKDKYATVQSILKEYGVRNACSELPDMFLSETWSDDLYAVYVIAILTATDTESLDLCIRPLLLSANAVSHILHMIDICESLLTPVVQCIVRSVNSEGDATQSSNDIDNRKGSSERRPLLWLYSSILTQIAQSRFDRDNDATCAATILSLLSTHRTLAAVCIELCTQCHLQLSEYVSDNIPSSASGSSRKGTENADGAPPPFEMAQLWIFRQCDSGQLRVLLLHLLEGMQEALGRIQSFTVMHTHDGDGIDRLCGHENRLALQQSCRVSCAVLSVLQTHPSADDPSKQSNPRPTPPLLSVVVDAEVEAKIVSIAEHVFRLLKLSLADAVCSSDKSGAALLASFLAQCVRVVTPLLLTALTCFCSHSPAHQTAPPPTGDTSAFSSLLLMLLTYPLHVANVHPPRSFPHIHKSHEALLAYCSFLRSAFSLNRIAAVREALGRELDLGGAREFVPQGSFVFLAQIMSAATISSGVFGQNDADTSLSPRRLGLIERNKDVLLEEVGFVYMCLCMRWQPDLAVLYNAAFYCAVLMSRPGSWLCMCVQFHRLSIPTQICSRSEFPGDWVFSLLLLLRCHILHNNSNTTAVTTPPPVGVQKDSVDGTDGDTDMTMEEGGHVSPMSLRRTMTAVLDAVSFPPHSLLLDTIELWLDLAVNGYDDGGGTMPPPHVGGDAGSTSNGSGGGNGRRSAPSPPAANGRDVLPFLPDQIRARTACLEGFTTPAATVVCPRRIDSSVHTVVTDIVSRYGLMENPRHRSSNHSQPLFSALELTDSFKQHYLRTHSPLSSGGGASESSSRDAVLNDMDRDITTFGSTTYRAVVACYTSLRYQWMCNRSPRAGFRCLIHCDPRDLPVKRCLSVQLAAVQWLAESRSLTCEINPYPSRCASLLLSSFVQLIRQLCPEVLLRERFLGLSDCLGMDVGEPRAPSSQPYDRPASQSCGDCIPVAPPPAVDFLEQVLRNPSQEVLATVYLLKHCSTAPKDMTDIPAHLCPARVGRAVIQFVQRTVSRIIADAFVENIDYSAQTAVNMWKIVHALHPRSSYLELDTFNCLLELGNVRRPSIIPSYRILIQEPILLFRLPVSLLQIPLVMELVLFIFRSLLVASRTEAQETLRSMQARYQQLSRSAPVEATWSLLQAVDQIDDNQFANLQEIISIRLLFELWHAVSEGIAVEGHRDEEQLGDVIIRYVSTLLGENRPILDILMHYGIKYWSCFVLIAQCEDLLEDVADLLLNNITTAVESGGTDPSYWTRRNVVSVMIHLHFLLRAIAVTATCRVDIKDSVHRIVEVFYWFVKKSLTHSASAWLQPPSALQLPRTCLETLEAIAVEYPQITLRVISCLTKREVVQSSSPNSVLKALQGSLLELHGKVCQNAVKLTIQKRIRSSSELLDSDVRSVMPEPPTSNTTIKTTHRSNKRAKVDADVIAS